MLLTVDIPMFPVRDVMSSVDSPLRSIRTKVYLLTLPPSCSESYSHGSPLWPCTNLEHHSVWESFRDHKRAIRGFGVLVNIEQRKKTACLRDMASFMITDVRIFTGEHVIESGYVIVKDGVIKEVKSGEPRWSDVLPIIHASGNTLLPGLIDAHIHAHDARVAAMENALRFGVTTVLDMHNERDSFMELKRVAGERKDVSDFKCAGRAATIEDGWPAPVVLAKDSGPWV